MCVSHHLGLEIQLNEMLTDRARGGGGDGVGCASQSRCGSDRELCKRLEKTNRPSFPRCRKGACGKSVGRQVKVHKSPVAAKCLLQSAGIRRTGFYLNTRAKSLRRAPRQGKGASGRDAFSAQGGAVAVRGS